MTVKLSGDADVDSLMGVLEDMPQICTLFLTLGGYDMFLMASVVDTDHFYMVAEEIRLLDGVDKVETSTIISRRKLLNLKIT